MVQLVKDRDWVKNSLMIPNYDQSNVGALDGNPPIFSSAYRKFTDTTLGGNMAMNPPPQFTEYADPSVGATHAVNIGQYQHSQDGGSLNSTRSFGMGRRYSEMIDDNAQHIHIRCGVPEFNSITRFFSMFYDHHAAYLSRTGRAPGFFYNLGRAAGFVVTIPLLPLIAVGKIYDFLANKNSGKFYHLKPVMPLYWQSVNSMANTIAVNMGIVPRVLTGGDTPSQTSDRTRTGSGSEEESIENIYDSGKIEQGVDQYSSSDIQAFHNLLPKIFRESGGIDIYAVANRAQRIANEARKRAIDDLSNTNDLTTLRDQVSDYVDQISSRRDTPQFDVQQTPFPKSDSGAEPGFETYISAWKKTQPGKSDGEDLSGRENTQENKSWFSDFVEFSQAELDDGGQFVTFRVNHTETISESFSNEVGESEIAQTVNGTSAQARSKRFTFANGNLGDGAIADMVEGVGGAVKDLAGGALDSIGLGGLMAFAGNAYTDIPQVWQDSSVTLPKSNYNIQLRTPYGNKMSRFTNLYVPMCMLVAMALPKSTGKASYDAPFLVELYDKGRAQVRLGIVDSMTITRGVGNVGWTQDHEPLGIDIDFSVVDLSSIMHMPLNNSPGLFEEDSPFNDYMATLGGLSLADQIYQTRKLKINLTNKLQQWESWKSPARWGMWPSGNIGGRSLSRMTRFFGGSG